MKLKNRRTHLPMNSSDYILNRYSCLEFINRFIATKNNELKNITLLYNIIYDILNI